MADAVIAELPIIPTKKKSKKSRKTLQENSHSSSNEANISVQKVSEQQSPIPLPLLVEDESSKENHESLSQLRSSPKKGKSKATSKAKKHTQVSSFEKEMQEMQEMQEMMEKLKIEKERTEDLLKEKDEMLKQREEELESKEREQEKLLVELKKLQKLKEFKPTVAFPFAQAAKENELDKKEKKKKKKNCPEMKRPSPAYALWCKDQWNEIKKENPEAEFKEISNILGAKWKNVTAEEKKPYEERYQVEKEAYLQIINKEKREAEAMKLLEDEHKQKTAMELLEQYLRFKHETEQEETKKSKKVRDPMKPKQPMSAFFLFSNERRPKLLEENKNVSELAKVLGEEWKNMSEKKKKPYEEMAKKNKDKYMEEMEIYKQMKAEEAESSRKEEEELMKLQKQEALQLLKKKEKTDNIIKKNKEEQQKKKGEKKVVDPNKPKKPASSYLLFSMEERKTLKEERPGTNNSTLTALISLKWKELSEEERAKWNAKAAETMEAYKKEMEEYNKLSAEKSSNE